MQSGRRGRLTAQSTGLPQQEESGRYSRGAAHAVVAGLVLVGQMKRIDSAAALVNVYFSEA